MVRQLSAWRKEAHRSTTKAEGEQLKIYKALGLFSQILQAQRRSCTFQTVVRDETNFITILIQPKFRGVITKNQKSYEEALKNFRIVDETKKCIESWMQSSTFV